MACVSDLIILRHINFTFDDRGQPYVFLKFVLDGN